MSSTVRSLKGLVTKRNDAAVNWLQNSTQALTDIQPKESARRIKSCDRYIDLLETSLTKLTKAFDEAPETTEEEEDHLDKYIEKTQATIMKLHDHRTQLEETLEDIGIEADDRSSPSAVSRLPVIPIPTFTGRKWEWDNFWALYKANVHDQNLSQLQKFNYLLASLSGEAKQSVSRFFVSANNYEKAIQHLTKRYGNKDGIILELNRSLHNCVAKGPSTTEQRQLWDKLSTIAAQLQEHEEQLNNQLTIQIFVQKFHARIRKAAMEQRLQHQEEHRSEWTLNQWLDAIDNVILQEEQLNHMLSVDGQFTGPPLHNTTTTKTHPDLEKNWKRGTLCECCGDKSHRWTTCPLIPTAIQKKRFLFEANRCLNCGSENHRIASCWSGSCRKCYKKHHTAACTESTPQEPKSCDKSNQHAETRFTNGEIAQGTFPINKTASRSFEPETATTLLLRPGHAASCLHSSSDSEATAKRTLFDDNFKERSRRQPKSNVPPQLLESNNAKPPAKKGLVTATSTIATTATSKLLSSNSDSDMDSWFPVLPGRSSAKRTALETGNSRSDDEGTMMHRSWKNSNSKPQHQEVRDWMQSMNQHFEAFIREMEKGFYTFQEEIKRQHEKAHRVKIRKEHQALRRTTQPEDEAKGEHVKNCKHRKTSLTTSQRRSNTATSWQKGRSTEWRNNNALTSEETPKRKERKLNSSDGQGRQAPSRDKEEESQKRLEAKRPVSRTGQAGDELHSYHSTRNGKRAKHSNVGHSSSDGKHSSGQRQTQRLMNSAEVRRSHARKGVTRTITTGKAPKVSSSEQIPGNATENMVHSTQSGSEVARRKGGWSHIALRAPWQGAFYKRIMRCIRKTLYYTLGLLAMAFDGFRTTLTDMKAESNSRWRSRQQQKIRIRYDTGGGLKKSPDEGSNLLLENAVRPKSTHGWKTASTVQIDEAPQKATGEAVMEDPGGSGLRRRSTHAPLKIDKQGYKATRCNANQGKNPPKRNRATSSDVEVKVDDYLDDYFTINGVTPLVC